LGQVHVGVAHDHIRARHRLQQVRHAAEHVIGLGAYRAMIDYKNSLHVLKMVAETAAD
jgi:hypothetical protein